MGVRDTTKNAKIAKVRLGDVAVVSAGQGAPQGDSAFSTSGGIPFVRAGHLVDLVSGLPESQLPGVSEEVAKKYRLKLQHRGTVLFAKSGMSCMKGLVYRLKTDCYVVSHLATVKTDSDITDHYLEFYFQKHKPNLLIKDPAYPSLSLSDISQIRLALPPLPEQKRIAEELDRICELKKNAEERLALMDQLVKSRFVEMFGDLQTNNKGWSIAPFEDAATIDGTLEKDFKRYADYPHIGIDSIAKGTGELVGYRTVAQDGVISGKYHFTAKHIIYSKIRPNLNKVALPDFEGLCSADAYAILPTEKADRVYLAYVLRSQFFLDYIIPLSGRTGMPKANRKQIQGFEFPLPPLALQRKFAAFVAEVNKSKFILRETVAKMETLYRAKLQEYFG